MDKIFGLAFLKNNRIKAEQREYIITELLRSYLGSTESISLVATSDKRINVVQEDCNLAKFLHSQRYKAFISNVVNEENLFSVIGSIREKTLAHSAAPKTSIISIRDRTISVHAELPINYWTGKNVSISEYRGKEVSKTMNDFFKDVKNESLTDTIVKTKNAAKNVAYYACVNANSPSTLIITRHTVDPFSVFVFPVAGVLIFAPLSSYIINIAGQFDFGDGQEDLPLFPNKTLIVCLKNNTSKVINIFKEVKNAVTGPILMSQGAF